MFLPALGPVEYGFAHGEYETVANWRIVGRKVGLRWRGAQRSDDLCY